MELFYLALATGFFVLTSALAALFEHVRRR